MAYMFFIPKSEIAPQVSEEVSPAARLSSVSSPHIPLLHCSSGSWTHAQQLNILENKIQQLQDCNSKLFNAVPGKDVRTFARVTRRQQNCPPKFSNQSVAHGTEITKPLQSAKAQLTTLEKTNETLQLTLDQRKKLLQQTQCKREHIKFFIKFKEDLLTRFTEERQKNLLEGKCSKEELPSLREQLKKVQGVNEFLRQEVMNYESKMSRFRRFLERKLTWHRQG